MECDILIIGCGPSGLSAAGYAARAGYDVLAIDSLAPGGQLLYIDEIENYPGTEKTSGYALAESFEKQAVEFGVRIEYWEAKSIEKDGDNDSREQSNHHIPHQRHCGCLRMQVRCR